MTTFYNNQQVLDLIENGLKVPESGKYKVHVLAKEGSGVRLEIGNKAFDKTHTGEKSEETSWNKAGEMELEADKTFEVNITPEEAVGEVSIALETLSEHNIFNGFTNMFKRIFSGKSKNETV